MHTESFPKNSSQVTYARARDKKSRTYTRKKKEKKHAREKKGDTRPRKKRKKTRTRDSPKLPYGFAK
jgi:hypothetical protein